VSNGLAIAAVTTAFSQRIAAALIAVPNLSSSPEVRLGRPGSDLNFVGANLFLYRASPNGARRNDDLTTRASDGAVVRRPQAALDLDYVISFHGDEATLEPQRLMGGVIAALHAAPILSPDEVRGVIAGAGPHGALAGADYGADAAPVRFVLQPQDMDTVHRLWALFPATPYALSVIYTGSAVVIDADVAPVRALPARSVVVEVAPRPDPVIQAIEPPVVVYGAQARLRITGENFGDDAWVLIDEAPLAATAQAEGVSLPVPPGVPAGVRSVRIASGPADAPALSARAALVVRPRVADGAVFRATDATPAARPSGVASLNVRPTPRLAQSACLFLNPAAPDAPGGEALVARSSVKLLRASIDLGFAAALDGAVVTAALAQALGVVGVGVAAGSAVEVLQAGLTWRLAQTRDGSACRLVTDEGGQIAVFPKLAADLPEATAAFALDDLAPGTYLASVQIGEDARATSPLRAGQALFTVTEDAAPLDRGVLPKAAAAAFAAASVQFSPQLSIARPMPGDGWELRDGARPQVYWLRQDGGELSAYALDTPDAPFVGPLLTIPAAGG